MFPQLVYNPDEVEEAAAGMIGDLLVTKQTGEAGRICNSVMVTERKYTRKEFYIAFMNERAFAVRTQLRKQSFIRWAPAFFLQLHSSIFTY